MAASKNEPGFLEKLGLAVSSVGLEGVVKNAPAFLIPGVLDNIASREKSRQQIAGIQAAADVTRLIGDLFGRDDAMSARQQIENIPATQRILSDVLGPEEAQSRAAEEQRILMQQGGQNRLARAQARRALVASGVDPETARKQTKGQGYATLQGVVQGDLAEAPKRQTNRLETLESQKRSAFAADQSIRASAASAEIQADKEKDVASFKFGLDKDLARYKADVDVDKTRLIEQAKRDIAAGDNNSAIAAFEQMGFEPDSYLGQQVALAKAVTPGSPLQQKALDNIFAVTQKIAENEAGTQKGKAEQAAKVRAAKKQIRSLRDVMSPEQAEIAERLLKVKNDPTGVLDSFAKSIIKASQAKESGPQTVVNIGGSEATTATVTNLQSKLIQAREVQEDIEQSLNAFDPSLLGYVGKAKAAVGRLRSRVTGTVSEDDTAAKFAGFKLAANQGFVKFRKFITGVAGGEKELVWLLDSFPNVEDDPTTYYAKSQMLLKIQDRAVANLEQMLGDGLSVATSEQIIAAYNDAGRQIAGVEPAPTEPSQPSRDQKVELLRQLNATLEAAQAQQKGAK